MTGFTVLEDCSMEVLYCRCASSSETSLLACILIIYVISTKISCQGSYRQVRVQFKDLSRTSKEYPPVFRD